ncbi:MAG TPA: glutamate racemase [Tepidisphaeraceae bacterium]|jgi:glutamate racemase|nr:glutamate racemase [Tepidisphaeraceae bacterium]
MSPASPIAVLDSGLGGLTVVRALRKLMPQEKIIYFGDTARLPYGSKTAVTISGFVQQIIEYLQPHDPKHVVIACNTATALALPAAREAFPHLPITGVIDPGAKAAVVACGANIVARIGVIATEATVHSRAYERAIHRRRHLVRVFLRPAPLLAPIIEEGRVGADPLVRLALQQYLEPLFQQKIDVLVLGCTHYPVYRDVIQEMAGSAVRVIDSAEQCAEDVARRLRSAGLVGPSLSSNGPGENQFLSCFVTDDPARFQRLAPRFLGVNIAPPALVAPEDLYELRTLYRAPLGVPA